MTGMEHAIEKAAQVLNDEGAHCGDCGREPGEPLSGCPDCERFIVGYARALAEAGWLAPAPLGREWAVEVTDPWGDLRYDRHSTREAAEDARWSDGNDRLVHRHVTAWEPADGIDRSEGTGGKAATGE